MKRKIYKQEQSYYTRMFPSDFHRSLDDFLLIYGVDF